MELALPLLFTLLLFLVAARVTLRPKKPTQTGPPSPPALPLVGHLHLLGGGNKLLHHALAAISAQYGPLVLLKLGQIPTLVVSSAAMARELLRDHDLQFATRPKLLAADVLSYGSLGLAFSPYGEQWRFARKLTTMHVLSNARVVSFNRIREQEVAFMLEQVKNASLTSSGSVVDMSKTLYFYANDMICRAVCGKYFRKEKMNDMFRDIIEEGNRVLGLFVVGDFFPSLAWMDTLLGTTGAIMRNFRRWDDLLRRIVKDHRERREANNGAAAKTEDDEDDFVDVMLAMQCDGDNEFELTDEIIKCLLEDMFAAGTETSSITLEWAMSELIRNPEAMSKLQNEARTTAGKSGCSKNNSQSVLIKAEELASMPYLKAVVKETLRLHPPVPLLIPRECASDATVGGYTIAKGTRVFVNYWAIGREPDSWDRPAEFRPERFVGSALDLRGGDFQLIPFGAGRRICPGMQFALATVELALANLVARFGWELPAGVSRDELDMSEAPGLSVARKTSLRLVPKPLE